MGLEVVELIMRVEEEFGIVILDEEAELIATPGALCDLIERKLGVLETEKWSLCPTSRAFYRVRRELMNLGVERKQIKPKSAVETLLPCAKRRAQWTQLKTTLPAKLKPLRRPDFVSGFIVFWFAGSLLSLPLSLFYPVVAATWFLGGGLTCLLLHQATAPLTLLPPSNARTVADLARRVAFSLPLPQGYTQTHDLWPKVQRIIADELSVPIEKVTRDADFYRDLGAG